MTPTKGGAVTQADAPEETSHMRSAGASLYAERRDPEGAAAIAHLPERYRSVLTLALVERRKYTQIAAMRGCSVGTIKGQVARGKRLLQVRQGSSEPLPAPSEQPLFVASPLPQVEALPEPDRSILVLRERQGSSYAQIAAQLHLPLGQVKKRLHKAREAYRRVLNPPECQPRVTVRHRRFQMEDVQRLNRPVYQGFYEVLSLASIEQLSNQEIATRLQLPLGTVKARLARGVKMLKR